MVKIYFPWFFYFLFFLVGGKTNVDVKFNVSLDTLKIERLESQMMELGWKTQYCSHNYNHFCGEELMGKDFQYSNRKLFP